MPSFRVKLPDQEEPTCLLLSGARITVGRLPLNTVQIVDRTVSGFHAEFIQEGEHYRLHDRGSTNGTFVNGVQTTDCHLREACKITFGSVEGEFSLETPVPGDAAAEALPSRGEVNSVRQENAALKSQIDAMKNELASLRTLTGAAGESIPISKEEFIRLNGEHDRLRERVQTDEQEIAKLKSQVAILHRDRENLEKAVAQSRSALEAMGAEPREGGVSQNGAPAQQAEANHGDAVESVLPPPVAEAEVIEPDQTPTVEEAAVAPAEPSPVAPLARPKPPGGLPLPSGVPMISAAKPVPPPAPPIARPVSKAPSMPAAPATPVAPTAVVRSVPPAAGASLSRPLPGGSAIQPRAVLPGSPPSMGVKPPGAPGGGTLPPIRPPVATAPKPGTEPVKPIFQRIPQPTAGPTAPGTERIDVSKLPMAKPLASSPKPPGKLPLQPTVKLPPSPPAPPAQP